MEEKLVIRLAVAFLFAMGADGFVSHPFKPNAATGSLRPAHQRGVHLARMSSNDSGGEKKARYLLAMHKESTSIPAQSDQNCSIETMVIHNCIVGTSLLIAFPELLFVVTAGFRMRLP